VGVVTGAKIIYGRDASFNYGSGKVAFAPVPGRRLRLDEDQFGHLLTENRISLQNALFRNDCFPGKIWFDPRARANEDWEFAIRLVQNTTVYEDTEPVVIGFVSPDSISTNYRKQTIGILRIMRNNKLALSSRRKQRSYMLLDIARSLYKSGKIKSSTKFILAAFKDYPPIIGTLSTVLMRKLFFQCCHLRP
jgi:hypothetical protein